MNPCSVLCSFLLSLTIPVYIVIAIDSPSRSSSCHPGQRDALLQLKNSFMISGPTETDSYDVCMGTSYPKTDSWREDEDCCSWEGVTCDNSTGNIVGLDLNCARLRGAIDSNSSLFSLRHLWSISLAGNDFFGSSIPPEISVFSQMTYLSLSSSNISGNVPPEISQLSKLVSLDLSSNGLEMQTPTMLVKNLTQLEELHLASVNMSGVIPTSLMNFSSSLISLDLSGCSLGGKFPDYIFQLPNLQQLDLSSNSGLHGTLPESNWSSSLAFLSLSGCSFNGGVPNSIGTHTQLTYLDLSWNNFTGGVPNSIGTLTRLTSLDLSLNNFNGGVPNSIGALTRLTSLDLSFNNFNGGVPNSIGALTRLTSLDLSWNNFNGGVPNSIGTLTRLTSLDLSRCSFGWRFPENIFQLPNLLRLDLSWNSGLHGTLPKSNWSTSLAFLSLRNCSFNGGVPNSIGALTRLTSLYLSRNNFNGVVPNSIGTLAQLTYLDLSWNNFTGDVDFRTFSTLKNLRVLCLSGLSVSGEDATHASNSFPQLQILKMDSCNLTKFPSFLSQSNKLGYLHLSGNRIQEIPSWFWGIGIDTLEVLYLQDNLIRGGLRLPWKRLANLRLQNNSFEGPLPIPTSRSLSEFRLSQNRFNGSIPLSICNATNLLLLDVSNNSLTGTLPQCLKNIMMGLYYLNIRANNLHGLIPEIFPEVCSLAFVDFSRNQFNGSLPRSLSNCKNLEAMDVGSNMIVDSFPSWLGDLPLKVLDLRSNKFHDGVSISEGTSPFSSIRILDISNNSFDGSLPDNLITETFGLTLGDGGNAIGYMTGSEYYSVSSEYYSVMIIWKGVEIEMAKINVQFAILDLSSNHFRGEIPRNIGLLKSLMSLNFSHNSFMGTIPPSLGNLTNLESLDLSSNHLVGGIPRELAQLTSLGALDLSRNNLTGPIPLGGHFNTFPNSSFEGNPGLCGIPFTRSCGQGRSEAQPRPEQRDDRKDEDGGWLEWKFVAMGFGSGVGIGISLGYMALEMGRPLWLARMVIRLEGSCRKRSKRKGTKRNGRR